MHNRMTVIERVMHAYGLMVNLTAEQEDVARKLMKEGPAKY